MSTIIHEARVRYHDGHNDAYVCMYVVVRKYEKTPKNYCFPDSIVPYIVHVLIPGREMWYVIDES